MSKTFIGIVTAATIAITSISAGQAQAGGKDDARKLLFGAATLFIIGKALSDANNRNRAQAARATPAPAPVKPTHVHRHPPKVANVVPHPPKATNVLPGKCYKSYRTPNGKQSYFSKSCLSKKFSQAQRIPAKCEQEIWTDRGIRRVYGSDCLNREGYRIQAKRH